MAKSTTRAATSRAAPPKKAPTKKTKGSSKVETRPAKGSTKGASKSSTKTAAKGAAKSAVKSPTKTAAKGTARTTDAKSKAPKGRHGTAGMTTATGKAARTETAAGSAEAQNKRLAHGAAGEPAATTSPGRKNPKQQAGKAAAATGNALRERFAALATAKSRINSLKRSIGKNFFDVGIILNEIRDDRLYEVKGYGSFEAFLERELDLNRVVGMRTARIAQTMIREAALEAGLDRASAAVAALDGEDVSGTPQLHKNGAGALPFSAIPPHKR